MSALPAEELSDLVFKALADGTRRSLVDALGSGPRTTGELCAEHPEMTRFGVMSHLKVLEEAGLIFVSRKGRERYNYLNPVPIRKIYHRWIKPYAEELADELIALKKSAEKGGRRG